MHSKKLVESCGYFCQEKNLSLNLTFILYNNAYLGKKKLISGLIFQIILRSKHRSPLPCQECQVCVSSLHCTQSSLFMPSHSRVTSTFVVYWSSVFFRIHMFCLLSRTFIWCSHGQWFQVLICLGFCFVWSPPTPSKKKKVIVPLFSLNWVS